MSRQARTPISIPLGVKLEVENNKVFVTGPRGIISRLLPKEVKIRIEEGKVFIDTNGKIKRNLALQGTIWAHVNNMIKGVTEGWTKSLELNGAGYKAEVREKDLILNLGYSHPVIIKEREGVIFKVEKSTITVEGINKDTVGQVAAEIRAARPPDPYKAMGLKYVDEIIKKKPGKQAAKAEGAAK